MNANAKLIEKKALYVSEVTEIAKQNGVGRSTVYKLLKNEENIYSHILYLLM